MIDNESWLRNKYKTFDIMTGYQKVKVPSLIEFVGIDKACEMLKRNIDKAQKSANGIKFIEHADVDVDGISSAYIMYKFLCRAVASSKVSVCINKERVHGICERHVEVFNSIESNNMVIIVDSSSKCREYIEDMNCDVLVLDHHNMAVGDVTYGNTKNGEFVIINNTVGEDTSIKDMSGAEVVYEFLRYYQAKCCRNGYDILEAERLYQWVAMSLFTDVINTDTERNQWYLEKAFDIRTKFENNLGIMCSELNKYQNALDKSFINFNFASTINSAIRAGASEEALGIVFNHPEKVGSLLRYKEIQKEILSRPINSVKYSTFCMADISGTDISSGYCGLIASKLLDSEKVSTIVYRVITEDGIQKAKGSFRGLSKETKYQEMISHIDGCTAEGHSGSFGFTIPLDLLVSVMNYVTQGDSVKDNELVTFGNIVGLPQGKIHFNSDMELKANGLICKIAMVNSRVVSNAAINITCMNDSNVKLISTTGKLYNYNVHGIECKAFEPLNSRWIELYFEYRNGVEQYARNKNV